MTPRETISALHDDGMTPTAIVRRTGFTRAVVDYQLTALGEKPPRGNAYPAYERRGSQVQPYSPQEDAFIASRRVDGWSLPAIGKGCVVFGKVRRASSVYMRLLKLAATEDAA